MASGDLSPEIHPVARASWRRACKRLKSRDFQILPASRFWRGRVANKASWQGKAPRLVPVFATRHLRPDRHEIARLCAMPSAPGSRRAVEPVPTRSTAASATRAAPGRPLGRGLPTMVIRSNGGFAPPNPPHPALPVVDCQPPWGGRSGQGTRNAWRRVHNTRWLRRGGVWSTKFSTTAFNSTSARR